MTTCGIVFGIQNWRREGSFASFFWGGYGLSSAATCRRFGQGTCHLAARGRRGKFDGDKSPAQSGDKSPQSTWRQKSELAALLLLILGASTPFFLEGGSAHC
jgi:hypothetical protein